MLERMREQLRFLATAHSHLILCLNDQMAPNDQPAVVQDNTPRLSPQQIRRLQLQLIEQLPGLEDTAIAALVPQQARDARTNALRTQIQQNVDAAIQCVRDNPNGPAANIRFPEGVTPLSVDVITRLRNFIRNNQQAEITTLRDQLVQTRLDAQLPPALRTLLRELLTTEVNGGNFGPISMATYNRVSLWLHQRIIATLQNLDDRMMAFPPGCPVEPPLSPLSSRHVSDELFRAMIRRMRPGIPGPDINFQLPNLAADAVPTPQHFEQFWNALSWHRDATELLAPISSESQRQVLSGLITRYNRPGWGQDRHPNPEQWQARAQSLVDLETQMRSCAELIVNLNRTFNTFPLHGVVGGNPPFPGQIEVRDGRIVRIVPDLPDNLDLTLDNRRRIERCVAWLQHHGERVNTQLARLFSAESNGANIFMLGDIEPAPGDPRTINGRAFNLITFDIDIRRRQDGRYDLTPITRYRDSPWYNYLNRLVDGTVHEERGTTETLNANDLILVNRRGNFELMTVENAISWRSNHTLWNNIRDGVTAAIDLSMIVMGGVEARAAWTATGQLAARAGMGAARRYMLQTLALRRGGWHMLLGGSGVLSSAYFGDHDRTFLGMTGQQWRNTRHYTFLADGGLQLAGRGGLGSIGFHRAISHRMERVVSESFWLRNLERMAELNFLHYIPLPYMRFAAPYRLASPPVGFAHLSTGRYALPTLMVGMTLASMAGMIRDGRAVRQDGIDLGQLAERIPHTAFIESTNRQLLSNANISQEEITRLLGIVADNRPAQNPPVRRRNVEQQLITEFNRNGATDRDRLAAGLLLLIEAGRNSPQGVIPDTLGEAGTSITSQSVRDFIVGRFNNSQNPEIRFQAAQALLATEQLTPQEFTTFCMTLASNNNLDRNLRAQVIMAIGLNMMIAGEAEASITQRIQSGQADQSLLDAYLTENSRVTRQDLYNCLQTIASTSGGDNDIRALCAGLLHRSEQGGSFQQVLANFQSLAASWHATRNQPAGNFATGLITQWNQDLSIPLDVDNPNYARDSRIVFNAARTLRMLADQSFRPIWQAHNLRLATNLLGGAPEAGMLGFAHPLAALNARPLTAEALNNALISCVNASDPEQAIRALTQLLPSLGTLNQQQIASGMVPLRAEQTETLRSSVRLLLARLSLPVQGYQGAQNDALSIDAITGLLNPSALRMGGLDQTLTQQNEQQQVIRAVCRRRIIELLPDLFASASDATRNIVLAQLGATLAPEGAMLATDAPELRQAAALALGRMIAGRPTARHYVGNQDNTIAADTLGVLTRQPNSLLTSGINQLLIQCDPTPLARLEAALRDSAPIVRLAAIEALFQARPARLSNGRTLQQLCADLLRTERDPAVLSALRRAEFVERAPDPTSPDYRNDFQRARHDLLFSLNCQGPRSLAGVPAFLFNPAHNLVRRLHLTPDGAVYEPYNRPYHALNATALHDMAVGNGPHTMDALKALVYIIVSRGRPFELRINQGPAVDNAFSTLFILARTLDVAANPQRAQDVLWALELCLVLNSGLDRVNRRHLLDCYMQLVQRMPADAARHHRAGVVASIVLERESVSWRPTNEERDSIDLQQTCIHHLGTYRTRAALPVLELITRNNGPAPVRDAARAQLQVLRSDPQIVAPGTIGGPLPGTVAFDDAYDALRRQLLDGVNGLFLQPGLLVQGRFNHFVQDPTEGPGRTPEQRALLLSFANGTWFTQQRIARYAPNIRFLWWQSHQFSPLLGQQQRGPNQTPQGAIADLLALARRDGSTAQGAQRAEELRAQTEARTLLAWIVAVNGEGLVHSLRDTFVSQAAACLAEISNRRLPGLADLDSVLESALVGQPFMSQDRQVRDHLITALWNRRASNQGNIANERVALILAGALRSEFLSMPRADEPGFAVSRDMQIRILGYLEQLGHRMCAPVVEALAMHHPVPEVRTRAQQTLLALQDNVWRVWNNTQPDSTTLPAARATALRNALNGNGAHDGVVQAIFNAYRGRPVVPNDPRYQPYLEGLSDTRPHVRLACALVVLRAENTAFNQADRQSAITVAADAALHGVHIGLRHAARALLLDNLPNGRYTVQPVPGRSIEIIKNAQGITMVETTNGRVTSVLLNSGSTRRFFYDEQNRLSRYIADDNREYTVVQRNGNQLTWSDGGNRQFTSSDTVTPAGALQHGIQMQISRVTYTDGRFQQFRFDGDMLTYLRDRSGTVYERVREGNTYTDVWTINGNNNNTYIGYIAARPDGTYISRNPSNYSNYDFILNPDGSHRWDQPLAGLTLRLTGERSLALHSDGRMYLRQNGECCNATINIGGGLELQQFAGGSSILRHVSSGRINMISYRDGSDPPYRTFTYNDAGVLTGMVHRYRGSEIRTTRIFNPQGQATRQYRVVGGGINNTYTGNLTITNGNYRWEGDDGYGQFQALDTGDNWQGFPRPDND